MIFDYFKKYRSLILTTRDGAMIRSPSKTQVSQALSSLKKIDTEHPDIALHNNEFGISIFTNNKIIFSNIESKDSKDYEMNFQNENDLWEIIELLNQYKIQEIQSNYSWKVRK